MKKTVTIIVPTLGKREYELNRLFQSLNKQTNLDFEVVVISQENHSLVEDVCKKYSDRMQIKHKQINRKGLSVARNEGIKISEGEIIILSDDDCWYPEEAIEYILFQFKVHIDMDILLTKIYDPICECEYKKYIEKEEQIRTKIPLLSKSSIEIAYKKEVAINFDERFGLGAEFVAGEENDFLIRSLENNKKIYYVPQTTVYHERKKVSESNQQIVAKGAFYSKNFNFVIANLILLRDLIKKKQNNYRWFFYGYYKFKKDNRKYQRIR